MSNIKPYVHRTDCRCPVCDAESASIMKMNSSQLAAWGSLSQARMAEALTGRASMRAASRGSAPPLGISRALAIKRGDDPDAAEREAHQQAEQQLAAIAALRARRAASMEDVEEPPKGISLALQRRRQQAGGAA